MKIIPAILIALLSSAQTIYELEPVVVTANRYPKDISEITRTVNIIDSTDIVKHPSLVEVLKNISSRYRKSLS